MVAYDIANIADVDYFPDCVLPQCDYNIDCSVHLGTPRLDIHQHILPKQQAILDSTAKYLFCQGGVGSAKSVAFAAKAVKLSLTIPGNEGVVCRKQLKDAYKSSWRDVKACIKRLIARNKIPEPKYSAKSQGDYSQITFHTGSIAYCIPGHNWSDALGPSYGWFWVDDCMECYEELFVGDDTSAGLISRLRLPHVHFDPITYDVVQREHGSMHGMVSTNPPPIGHWSHKLFGEKPGFYTIGDDSVEWIQTASFENPFTGTSYAKGLIAVQKRLGRNESTVRRVVFGESVPAYGGVPVYPQFNKSIHVAQLKFKPEYPLIRSWDFGHDHPAVIFAHVYECRYGTNHYYTLSEIGDVFNVTVYDLRKKVLEHTKQLYSEAKLVLDCGDRAGYRNSAANKDGRSDMKILIYEFNMSFKYRYMNLVPSLQYMRGLLQPDKPCKCGLEMVLVSNNCPVLIGALDGGFKLPKPRKGPVGDKPIEDKYFADVACAWRYGAENYVKYGVDWEDKKYLKQQLQGLTNAEKQQRLKEEPWAWMDMSDIEVGTLLTR